MVRFSIIYQQIKPFHHISTLRTYSTLLNLRVEISIIPRATCIYIDTYMHKQAALVCITKFTAISPPRARVYIHTLQFPLKETVRIIDGPTGVYTRSHRLPILPSSLPLARRQNQNENYYGIAARSLAARPWNSIIQFPRPFERGRGRAASRNPISIPRLRAYIYARKRERERMNARMNGKKESKKKRIIIIKRTRTVRASRGSDSLCGRCRLGARASLASRVVPARGCCPAGACNGRSCGVGPCAGRVAASAGISGCGVPRGEEKKNFRNALARFLYIYTLWGLFVFYARACLCVRGACTFDVGSFVTWKSERKREGLTSASKGNYREEWSFRARRVGKLCFE